MISSHIPTYACRFSLNLVRAFSGVRESRERPSCHSADWVHKAYMLIRACSGPRSSIIQQTGLFSIQLVLLLVVMAVVVEGGLGRREQAFL